MNRPQKVIPHAFRLPHAAPDFRSRMRKPAAPHAYPDPNVKNFGNKASCPDIIPYAKLFLLKLRKKEPSLSGRL